MFNGSLVRSSVNRKGHSTGLEVHCVLPGSCEGHM